MADDPKVARGWEITVWSRPSEQNYQGPTTHWRRETSGDKGRIDFGLMAEGRISWRITPPEGSRYLVAKQPAASIRAGETEEVEIPLVRGVRVEGVVREDPGGAPIQGIEVDVSTLRPYWSSVRGLKTDVFGSYSAVVKPGTIRFSYSWLERNAKEYYLPLGVQNWVDFEVKAGEERHEFNPPPLRKAALVRGRVVDEKGDPVPHASVSGVWTVRRTGSISSHTVPAEANARGEFVLGSLAPNVPVSVTASSGWVAVSDAVVVPKPGEGEPITIRLHNRPTLALSGRVLGPDGLPLADARIQVAIRPPGQPLNRGSGITFNGAVEVRTGPDGRYRTPSELPVKHEYRVSVDAPGYEPSTSRWIVDQGGEVPDLTLRRSIRMRGGRPGGRLGRQPGRRGRGLPVGRRPRRTRGLTDADGRFGVKKIPDLPAFLFVTKEGYRFIGRRIESGRSRSSSSFVASTSLRRPGSVRRPRRSPATTSARSPAS